jgi:GH18 family chitinase
VTSLDKFRQAFDVKEVSKIVDFIDFYTWDLEGPWSKLTNFGNAIESERKEILTLVSVASTYLS